MEEVSKICGASRARMGWHVALVVAAATLAACGGGQEGAEHATTRSDAQEHSVELVSVRLCDTSGCYVAWQVVDSDRDGVCDADELLAGTDPFDARSKPSLQLVADLAGKGALPSFEHGSGVFAVFPEKMQALLQEYMKGKGALEQAGAFTLNPERGDGLARFGIDAKQLADKGIDVARDGVTVGIDGPKSADSGLPGRRVGGIEVRLVSADDLTPLKPVNTHGGAYKYEQFAGGASRVTYNDGFTRTTQTDGTVVWRDADGKVTKVHPGAGAHYVNPEADGQLVEPTDEQKKAFERLRGAAIRTVDGWAQPELPDSEVKDPRTLIMLVDPLIADSPGMVFDAPRVTTAQPEVVPDLPRPDLPAGGGPGGCQPTGGDRTRGTC